MATNDEAAWLHAARAVLHAEASAINAAAARLGSELCRAVSIILERRSKVVVSGVGKSAHVGSKIAATLRSTGTPAVFVHPADALHGDLGMFQEGDVSLLISKSGSTAEILRLLPTLRELGSPSIAIVGNLDSTLAREADVVLVATVDREADPFNLAPTSSTTVALAIGDALAVALMHARRFSEEDFARFHPSGQLGRNLHLRVADVMHSGDRVAWVGPGDALRQVVIAMTRCPLGASCVVDEEHRLLGLITDGDVRRTLEAHDDIRGLSAKDVMTKSPTTIGPKATLKEALELMEDRPSQISALPVTTGTDGRCVGLIRLHDIYQPHLG